MDIKDFTLASLSRANTDYAAHWATENPNNFEALYQLIYADDTKLAWRSAWIVEKVQLLQPALLTDKLLEIIAALPHFKHDGSKRSLLLVILRSPLPSPIPVDLINLCFDWMLSSKQSIAVQTNSMKVLQKIGKQEPDLQNELMAYLSGDLSIYSKGFQASARKIASPNPLHKRGSPPKSHKWGL